MSNVRRHELSCDMGKISVDDNILIENARKEKQRNFGMNSHQNGGSEVDFRDCSLRQVDSRRSVYIITHSHGSARVF